MLKYQSPRGGQVVEIGKPLRLNYRINPPEGVRQEAKRRREELKNVSIPQRGLGSLPYNPEYAEEEEYQSPRGGQVDD